MHYSIILYILIIINYTNCQLEQIQDDELVNLIRTENYVVVLFTQKHCEQCEHYENELIGLREELVETLNCWVVKLYDSSLLRLYSPDKDPVIVFFRHGVPLLYDGPVDEHLLHVFSTNKDPTVRELNDDNFEHLTQVSTGATTGDWFIQFYTTDCIECQRLQARWETVGAHIKSRINVARVNRATTGAKTARRFNVFNVPAFILFKKGQMFKYHSQDFSIKSLVTFAQETHKKIKSEPVPEPKDFWDDLLAATLTVLWETPYLWQIGVLTFSVGLAAAFLVLKLTTKKPPRATKKQTTKQKKKPKKTE